MNNLERSILSTMQDGMRIQVSRIGVAVSGGSDSLAMLVALQAIGEQEGFEVHAFTVDHGLRKEAAAEASYVGKLCSDWGIPHNTLAWKEGSEGSYQGNIQAEAREARYRLLTAAAEAHDIKVMAIGHTLDDQAETVLMRMGRQSGTKGLRGISPAFFREGTFFVRPVLNERREALRDYLGERNIRWVDDPSNDNDDFDRIKARKLLASGTLQDIGITTEGLAAIAANMRDAEEALSRYAKGAQQKAVERKYGAGIIDLARYWDLPDETRRRLILDEIKAITGFTYPPRRRSLDEVMKAIISGKKATIGGCLVIPFKDQWKHTKLAICREPRSVIKLVDSQGLWDGRWGVPRDVMGSVGILTLKEVKESGLDTEGLPKEVFASMPAIRNQDGEVTWCPCGVGLQSDGAEPSASICSRP